MTQTDPRLAAVGKLLGSEPTTVRPLSGGTHAQTLSAATDRGDVVIRFFPPGDDAAAREVRVLSEIATLAAPFAVPHLIAADPSAGIIVTSLVDGGHPAPSLSPDHLAPALARTLAHIHAHPARRLAQASVTVSGHTPLAESARSHLPDALGAPLVLGHGDYWCGNALWHGAVLTGVVDWSGARAAPAGMDVAWCRQDLILLGDRSAADMFVDEYRVATASRDPLSDRELRAWDLHAAAHAEGRVATWAPNYAGIGRPWLTGDVLEARFAAWVDELLSV